MKSIKEFFNREQNLLVHMIVSAIVALVGIILKIDSLEWLLVLFSIALVVSSELINSSIELTVDLYTKKFNTIAMIAKDTSAAAVLVSAITAASIGIYVFLPKILKILKII